MSEHNQFSRPADTRYPDPRIETVVAGGPVAFIDECKRMVRQGHPDLVRELGAFRRKAEGARGMLSFSVGGGKPGGSHDLGYLTEALLLPYLQDSEGGEVGRAERQKVGRALAVYDESCEFLIQFISDSFTTVFRVGLAER